MYFQCIFYKKKFKNSSSTYFTRYFWFILSLMTSPKFKGVAKVLMREGQLNTKNPFVGTTRLKFIKIFSYTLWLHLFHTQYLIKVFHCYVTNIIENNCFYLVFNLACSLNNFLNDVSITKIMFIVGIKFPFDNWKYYVKNRSMYICCYM